MEGSKTSTSGLVLSVDEYKVVGTGSGCLIFVWMIPEIAEVGEQFVAIFPVVEVQGVEVVMSAIVCGIEHCQAVSPVFSCTQVALREIGEEGVW